MVTKIFRENHPKSAKAQGLKEIRSLDLNLDLVILKARVAAILGPPILETSGKILLICVHPQIGTLPPLMLTNSACSKSNCHTRTLLTGLEPKDHNFRSEPSQTSSKEEGEKGDLKMVTGVQEAERERNVRTELRLEEANHPQRATS